eukprot:13580169-Alexandrium_andersonii.AAC.1
MRLLRSCALYETISPTPTGVTSPVSVGEITEAVSRVKAGRRGGGNAPPTCRSGSGLMHGPFRQVL